MSRLTLDISDAQHRKLKALAAVRGQTLRDFILSRLSADLAQDEATETRRKQAIQDWEHRRKKLKLERSGLSLRELIHEGHQW